MKNADATMETTIVFVLKNPDVRPYNPFSLIDCGVFKREEVASGAMDFGPGYCLHSSKGYTLVREVQRVLLAFDVEKSNDYNCIKQAVEKVVKALALEVVAVGINFATNVNEHTCNVVDSAFKTVKDKLIESVDIGMEYKLSYNVEGVRKTISFVRKGCSGGNASVCNYFVTINNHIQGVSRETLCSKLDGMAMLKQSFVEMIKTIFA